MDEHPTDHPLVDDDDDSFDEDDEPRSKRRWPIVVVSVLIVIAAIGVALYLAASHYQPLYQGLDGGYGSQVLTSDGSLATNRVTGPAANQTVTWLEPSGSFRVEVLVELNDFQRFGITVDKVMAPPNPSGTSNVHVFFDSKGKGAGVYGYKGGPVFKPTTLASGSGFELAVHWTQQCVPASAQSGATTYTDLPVEYTFMGFRHTVTVPIEPISIAPRATC
jgi:hypothetical protein